MGEWTPTKLDELIEVKHGFAFKGDFFTDEETENFLLTPGNFAIGGGFQWGKRKFYKNGPVPEEYVLHPGDLLVTMTDLSKQADTLGYSAIVPRSSWRLLHNQRLGKIVLKNQKAEKDFLHWLMRSPDYRNEVLASCTGSTVKHTSPKKICNFSFLLPPKDEQRAIASLLRSLDDKIELNRRTNETLEAMARALFRDWFVDFGPTRAKMEGRDPYLAPDLWALFPDRLDDETGLPDGWELSEIGREVEAVGGTTPSTKEPSFWNGGVHYWATPKDLSRLFDPLLLDTERKITDSGLARISSGLLPIGTVLLSSRAPIGYLAIAEVPVAVNQGLIAMKCTKRLSNVFVVHWCYEKLEYIKGISGGSTFAEISKKAFRPIPVTVPSPAVRSAFNSIVQPLYADITLNVREARTLARTRDLLLPKLISGEISLRDAENVAGEALA
jgi:type I restriction enzyme S subunit